VTPDKKGWTWIAVDPHDEITEALQYGRITPVEADARLRDLGLAPLFPEPDPAHFDAKREAHWTLPMSIAWIAWRSHTEVAKVSERFREKCFFWEQKTWQVGVDGPTYTGWFSKWSGPANLLFLMTTEDSRRAHGTLPQGALSIVTARDALWNALERGVLQGTGVSVSSGERMVILDYEWRKLVNVVEGGGTMSLFAASADQSSRNEPLWTFSSTAQVSLACGRLP
jgi:hypothetical protein